MRKVSLESYILYYKVVPLLNTCRLIKKNYVHVYRQISNVPTKSIMGRRKCPLLLPPVYTMPGAPPPPQKKKNFLFYE